MSHPKRYSIRGFSAAIVEEDNGVMVKWEDYAALKAETIKRLEAAIPPVEAYIIKLEAENERLKEAWVDKKMQEDRDFLLQQVERLRKAGDALARAAEQSAYHKEDYNVIKAWLAAKESKP